MEDGRPVSDWRLWCRLCAMDDVEGNINVFRESKFETTIESYFGVKIIPSGELPEMLCVGCVSLLTALLNFSQRVAKVQQLYVSLQEETETGVNLDLTRLKHELSQNCKTKPTEFVEAEFTNTANHMQFLIESATGEKSEYYKNLDGGEILQNQPECDPLPINDGAVMQDVLNNVDEHQENRDGVHSKEKHGTPPVKNVLRKLQKKRKRTTEESQDTLECNSSKPNDFDQTMKYTCEECSRQFQRFYHYRGHMKRAHSQIIPLQEIPCPDCPLVFSAQYQLNEHAKKHMPTELKKTVPCPHCDKKFCSNTTVRLHIRFIHNDERSFICEECGVAMRTMATLKSHMLTHTDVTPFVCEICKKGFKKEDVLKKHMDIHDPKKFACTKCGKELNSRATLHWHSLVHSDVRRHKCDYCGSAFKTSKSLKVHLIVHTGLKPYFCEFCDRRFSSPSYLNVHKKSAHREQMAAQGSGHRNYTLNIPNIEALKAVAKTAKNLKPVQMKRSGCKPPLHESTYTRDRKSRVPAGTTKNDLLPASDIFSKKTDTPTTQNDSSPTLANDYCTTLQSP